MDAALEMIEKGYEKYQNDHWGPGFMFREQFVKDHPEVVKEYQELIVDEVPPLKCYLRHVVARQCHETTHLIHKIKAPTLVIVGSKDIHEGGTGSHVESAKVLAEKIPNAELVLVKGGRAWLSARDAGKGPSADFGFSAAPLDASMVQIVQNVQTVQVRAQLMIANPYEKRNS